METAKTALGWDGNRLKYLMKLRGMTQQELSNLMMQFIKDNDLLGNGFANVTQQNINRWANNQHSPKPEYLALMAIILDSTVDYFVGLTEVPELADESRIEGVELQVIREMRSGNHVKAARILLNNE